LIDGFIHLFIYSIEWNGMEGGKARNGRRNHSLKGETKEERKKGRNLSFLIKRKDKIFVPALAA
jgi:hypothetical protein